MDTLSFPDHFLSPTIRVIVGPEKTVYHIHQEILKTRSPYFARLLSFGGTEVTENTITLFDPIQPDAIRAFIEFIYTGNYQLPKRSDEIHRGKVCLLVAQIYVLADMMCMDDLKVAAVDSMVDLLMEDAIHNSPFTKVVEYVYGNTTHMSKTEGGKTVPRDELRAILSAYCCCYIESWMDYEEFSTMVRTNSEFAVDMLYQLKGNSKAFDDIQSARRRKRKVEKYGIKLLVERN
ncbi:hypothetical protein K440DRAFT_619482 [Wilcoxina mikolae CBS 423.85]|nr:hypothetical protein K440DRAFT_619482 [Wilcoxina mikolae CBS 423.85]